MTTKAAEAPGLDFAHRSLLILGEVHLELSSIDLITLQIAP